MKMLLIIRFWKQIGLKFDVYLIVQMYMYLRIGCYYFHQCLVKGESWRHFTSILSRTIFLCNLRPKYMYMKFTNAGT